MHIIQHPDHTTAPHVVRAFGAPVLMSKANDRAHYVGRNFTDMCAVEKIKEKRTDGPDIWDKIERYTGIAFIAFAASMIIGVMILLIAEGASINSVLPTLGQVALWIGMAGFGCVLVMGVISLVFAIVTRKYPDGYTTLSRTDRKVLEDVEYIPPDSHIAAQLHVVVINDLTTAELEHAYNDYVDLFVFVHANKDTLSPQTLESYCEELSKRRNRLTTELATRFNIVQDTCDLNALWAMPLPDGFNEK